MLADLLAVDVPMAALVELALGEKAQYLVVESDARLPELLSGERVLSGRAGFLPLAPSAAFVAFAASLPSVPKDFERRSGIIGRADRFVRTTAEFAPLVRHLLEPHVDRRKFRDRLGNRGIAGRPRLADHHR